MNNFLFKISTGVSLLFLFTSVQVFAAGKEFRPYSLGEIKKSIEIFEKGINNHDLNLAMSVISDSYSDTDFYRDPPWPLHKPLKSKEEFRKALATIMRQKASLHLESGLLEIAIEGGSARGHHWVRESYDEQNNFARWKLIELVKEGERWKISRWEYDPFEFSPDAWSEIRRESEKGKELLKEGNEKEGVDTLQKLIAKYPHSRADYAQFCIASYYFHKGDYQKALAEYGKVADIWVGGHTSGYTYVQQARQRMAIIKEYLDEPEILKLYAEGLQLYEGQKREEAFKIFLEIAAKYPESSLAPLVLLEIANTYSFEATFLKKADSKEKSSKILLQLIKNYPDTKEAKEAIELLKDIFGVEELKPLIAVFPQAPWAKEVKGYIVSAEQGKEFDLRKKEETPKIKKRIESYLEAIGNLDYTSIYEMTTSRYLLIRNGGTDNYLNVKKLYEKGGDLSNVNKRFILNDKEDIFFNPECTNVLASFTGKEVFGIFQNGSLFKNEIHYKTIIIALSKEKGDWKVGSCVIKELDSHSPEVKEADKKEVELLREWEKRALELADKSRTANILLGISERYEALALKDESKRIKSFLKEKYSDLYVIKRMTEKKENEHFYINYNIPVEYADAILNLCEIGYQGYKEVYGIDLLKDYPDPKIEITAVLGGDLSLWVAPDSNPDINLVTPSIERLGPPIEAGGKGAHHVYGFVHEMGHIAIGFQDGVWSQGLAHYIGSQLMPYVKEKLGDKAWPIPYDYVTYEGPARLMKGINNAKPGTEDAACKVLYEIEKKYGPKIIGQAVYKTKEMGHGQLQGGCKFYPVKDFETSLIQITSDATLDKLFEENGF